jgi:hypothetical protein
MVVAKLPELKNKRGVSRCRCPGDRVNPEKTLEIKKPKRANASDLT